MPYFIISVQRNRNKYKKKGIAKLHSIVTFTDLVRPRFASRFIFIIINYLSRIERHLFIFLLRNSVFLIDLCTYLLCFDECFILYFYKNNFVYSKETYIKGGSCAAQLFSLTCCRLACSQRMARCTSTLYATWDQLLTTQVLNFYFHSENSITITTKKYIFKKKTEL